MQWEVLVQARSGAAKRQSHKPRPAANRNGSLFQYYIKRFFAIIITPERHEDGVENGARVVEEVGYLLVEADVLQLPVITVVAQRAHLDGRVDGE